MSGRMDWKRRMLVELRQDKRKAVLLAVLLAAVIVVGARQGGKFVSASRAETSPGAGKVEPPGSGACNPNGPQADHDKKTAYMRRADRGIVRDIFAVRLDLFPPDEHAEPVKPTVSAASVADEEQAKVRLVGSQAQVLVLQSTVVGENATAVINGKVLRVGERINDFQVLGIQTQSCVIEKDGVKLTLTMRE